MFIHGVAVFIYKMYKYWMDKVKLFQGYGGCGGLCSLRGQKLGDWGWGKGRLKQVYTFFAQFLIYNHQFLLKSQKMMQDLLDRICTDELSLIDDFQKGQQNKIAQLLLASSHQKENDEAKRHERHEHPNLIQLPIQDFRALDESAEIIASFSHTLLFEQSHITPYQLQFPIKQNISTFPRRSNPSKKQKNSNAIKKIGRIILDNLRQYRSIQQVNTPLQTMLKTLSKSSKIGRTQINKRDKFNTYHLSLLFNGKDKKIIEFNLETTRKILNKFLRRNVLNSGQIDNRNKLIYMNTIKCSSLRCINRNLAIRLQMSL